MAEALQDFEAPEEIDVGRLDRCRPSLTAKSMRLGLRANLGQFALLVAVTALVGGMVGQERTVTTRD
jgi:hypothetical protein